MKILGITTAAILATMALSSTLLSQGSDQEPMKTLSEKPAQPAKPIVKTDAEWKKELTAEQYRILREAGTEAANGKVYKQFAAQGSGTYVCAGCGTELFSSKEKFDSHCGWPSFYDPSKSKNVKLSTDYNLGYARTEVRCATCDGHLGHVFKGEGFDTPTDKRFCINGSVLKFIPDPDKKEDAKK